uniref:Uncharacterized protein n=1 Tax=Rhizophora mucronata TaxID=61149 RepID=A0A2P2NCN9_RHIMU
MILDGVTINIYSICILLHHYIFNWYRFFIYYCCLLFVS